MRIFKILLLLAWALGPARAQNQAALIGIDHIPLAVHDLDRASEAFKRFGFAIKPGRQHGNSIRNHHIKFPDGSGLELITSNTRTDKPSAFYMDHLTQGDGPAFLSFHARHTSKLIQALTAAGIDFKQEGGSITFMDPKLDHVFVIADNRSPTDRPAHFAHLNGAFAMREVWLAMEDPAPLRNLLVALGATARKAVAGTPEPTQAEVFELQNGSVVVVPARHQVVPGRPVIGVVMSVREPAWSVFSGPRVAPSLGKPSLGIQPGSSASQQLVAPKQAHGLWLAFRREQ
jgi:Glyoxalase-like domain